MKWERVACSGLAALTKPIVKLLSSTQLMLRIAGIKESSEPGVTQEEFSVLLLGQLPQTVDQCEWANWLFGIVGLDGKCVDKVLAGPISPPPQEAVVDTPA